MWGEFFGIKMANEILAEQISKEYEYGFVTDIESENAPKGLNEGIIRLISEKKNEPLLLNWPYFNFRFFN